MAKAALNMMTRTSADDYRRQRIYMNSVDTVRAVAAAARTSFAVSLRERPRVPASSSTS